METRTDHYDCAIIGGGLAGLCLAVQLAQQGVRVVLFEKNAYPSHKVCGEYIGMESWDFLQRIGLPLDAMNLPRINRLGVSSEKGYMLNHPLAPGGFGISRYTLDHALCGLARAAGASVIENCRVSGVEALAENMQAVKTSSGTFYAKLVCGSFGKYTPAFAAGEKPRPTENFIGVKYHIRTDLPVDRIELHNFQDGYCGVSKVDGDRHCLCYLTTAQNLTRHEKNIKVLEAQVLQRNPHLAGIFRNADFLFDEPLVISNIQFSMRATASGGMLRLGDAAGCITPLCGNGMSMAMRASLLLASAVEDFFNNTKTKTDIARSYDQAWKAAFGTRISAGLFLQNLFGKRHTTDLALRLLSHTPALTRRLISLTHGQRF